MVKLGISGFCGKMGGRIFALAKEDKEFIVSFGLEQKGHYETNKEIEGIKIVDDPCIIKNCECLIEFSTPSATMNHLPYLTKFNKTAVIGTTGLGEEEVKKIKNAAESIPIVFSPNMSIGVNLLFKLCELSAKILKNYTVHITEAHHIHKKDAPSGTAKKIAEIINCEGFNIKAENIEAVREDEIVGDHKIIFESGTDKIELFHSAKTRDIFASGALLAAKWIAGQKKGLYSMDDVLELK